MYVLFYPIYMKRPIYGSSPKEHFMTSNNVNQFHITLMNLYGKPVKKKKKKDTHPLDAGSIDIMNESHHCLVV